MRVSTERETERQRDRETETETDARARARAHTHTHTHYIGHAGAFCHATLKQMHLNTRHPIVITLKHHTNGGGDTECSAFDVHHPALSPSGLLRPSAACGSPAYVHVCACDPLALAAGCWSVGLSRQGQALPHTHAPAMRSTYTYTPTHTRGHAISPLAAKPPLGAYANTSGHATHTRRQRHGTVPGRRASSAPAAHAG